MQKYSSIFKRVACLLLALMMLAGILSAVPATAGAAEPTKKEKTYEIAVAYDNSGSMYQNSNGWYQAKYAMEIFASMMNLEGKDRLTIFPMHAVNTTGASNTKKIVVKSTGDLEKIHNLYTPTPSGTPFTAVVEANSYLKKVNADEKWLIVLTDGAIEVNDLQGELMKMAKGKIKVQYLPFGGNVLSDSNSKDNFYASPQVSDEKALQSELISICNKIFQRDELKDRLNGKTLNLDLSMRKLVVFVQGKGAKINSLKDASGKEIAKLMDSGKRTYSDKSDGIYKPKLPAGVKDQSGQVVTFDACPKGSYTLDCSNAESVQIFYEPDVTMKVELINSDGISEDFFDREIPTGEYTYKVSILDNATGEDVINHELMGGNVKVDTTLTVDGKETEIENGGKVNFTPSEDVQMDIVATYLERYTLSNKDDPSIFPHGKITVEDPVPPLDIAMKLPAGNEYVLMNRKDWEPIRVELSVEGKPLTDEQLSRVALDIGVTGKKGEVPYRTEVLDGQSAVNVYIGEDESGAAQKLKKGKYDITVKGELDDGLDEPYQGSKGPETLNIETLPKWVRIGLWVLGIALIIFILGFPVKPSVIYISSGRSMSGAIKVGRSITVKCMGVGNRNNSAFTAKTRWNLKYWGTNSWIRCWLFKSEGMMLDLTKVEPGLRCSEVKIDNVSCDKNGVYDIGTDSTVKWKETLPNGKKTITHGTFKINRRN